MCQHPIYTEARTATSLSATTARSSNSVCLKCVTNRAGRSSCCARGGAWFKNCGDGGDTQFDHTWAEGLQACDHLVDTVLSVQSKLLAGNMLNMSRPQHATQQQKHVDLADSVSSAVAARSVVLAKVVVCICISYITPHL